MGDPKKPKKLYQKPSHPWQKARIEQEKTLSRDYGLRRKKEIWKLVSKIRSFKKQAKALVTEKSSQAEKEKKQLFEKLLRLGLLTKPNPEIEDVLAISEQDLFERRLQTVLVRKGLARTMKQARQMIVHKHIMVGKKPVTVPSYILSKKEEEFVVFMPTSPFADLEHPERVNPEEEKKEEVKDVKKEQQKEAKKEVKKEEKKVENGDRKTTASRPEEKAAN